MALEHRAISGLDWHLQRCGDLDHATIANQENTPRPERIMAGLVRALHKRLTAGCPKVSDVKASRRRCGGGNSHDTVAKEEGQSVESCRMNHTTALPQYVPQYIAFAKSQADALGCHNLDPNAVVWHYTTGAGLQGIIASGMIYATQVSCLNDSSEIRYPVLLLRRALLATLPKYAGTPGGELVKKYLGYLEENPDFPLHAPNPHFVACFSKQEDDLSQWRSYCGGENGYAIGFRVGDLFGLPLATVVRVNYDRAQHEKAAAEVAEATVRFFSEGLAKNLAPTVEQWGNDFLTWWDTALSFISPMIKDPGFKAEEEYRIVRPLFEADGLSEMKFIQKSTMMSRHLPLRLPAGGGNRLPITKVFVGPGRHREITRISVDALMRQKGYAGGLVFSSERPFQRL